MDAGNDRFPYELIREVVGEVAPQETLRKVGGQDVLNMTMLALNLSSYANGVSKTHRDISRELFPGYDIHAITNGVHPYTWTSGSFRRLYDQYLPGWAYEPELLARADLIPDEEILEAHSVEKRRLIDHVNRETDAGMGYDALTIGFARRATAYKRTNMLFTDVKRLRKINSRAPLQLIFAGKAHPRDFPGKRMIEEIFNHARTLKDEIRIAYLEDYDMEMASKLVAGVDVWLNTPLPPREASGTSGMKAAHNGVINFSVLDGWWTEGWMEDITGWSIGPHPSESVSPEERGRRELKDLYSKLEYVIVPKFYYKKDEWVRTMKGSITRIAFYFNSHRMMQRYVTEAYI